MRNIELKINYLSRRQRTNEIGILTILQYLLLFTLFVIVYNICYNSLQYFLLFTIFVIVYNCFYNIKENISLFPISFLLTDCFN